MAKILLFLPHCKYLRPKQMPFAHHSKLTPADILTNLNERLPRFAKSDFFLFSIERYQAEGLYTNSKKKFY
jgi:hypothetical protein